MATNSDFDIKRAHEAPSLEVESRRWFLVQAQAGREGIAQIHLERQGYRSFLPKGVKTARRNHRRVTWLAAYFPGYLFAELDLAVDRWRPIDSTIGVIRLVKIGAAPSPAPRGLVETLLSATDQNGVLSGLPQPAITETFTPGDTVKVVRGPFADQLGLIEGLDGHGRVRVLLDLMRLRAPIEFSSTDLSAA